METFDANEFVEFLSASGQENQKVNLEHKPVVKIGMAKLTEGSAGSFSFSEGTACKNWIEIPSSMVAKVEFVSMVKCKDHEHPLIRLSLKDPSPENREASVLADLARNSPLNEINLLDEAEMSRGAERSLATSPSSATSSQNLPRLVASRLASRHGVQSVIGALQCITLLGTILDDYDKCIENGGSTPTGCANIAARQIATLACTTYCDCG